MDPALNKLIETFNRGEYFAAAEGLEQLAAQTESDARDLIGVLNQLAAALHLRFERGGRQATVNLLSQALIALDGMKPARDGIDTERLFNEVSAYADEIRATPKAEEHTLKHRARLFVERRRAPKIHRT